MVDDDRDVLMVFFIAGLINTDVNEIVQPSGTLRFNVIQGAVDTPADSFLVDPHVLGNDTSGKTECQPSDSEVKVLCEAAVRVCLGDISDEDTVDRTFDAVGTILHLDKGSTPVKPPPYVWRIAFAVVVFARPVIEWAVIFMLLIRECFDSDVGNLIPIRLEVSAFYNSTLDIE